MRFKYMGEVGECTKGKYSKKWGNFSSCNAQEMDFQDWLDQGEKPKGLFCLWSMRHWRWERERGKDRTDGYRALEMGQKRWALACRIWQSKPWKLEIPAITVISTPHEDCNDVCIHASVISILKQESASADAGYSSILGAYDNKLEIGDGRYLLHHISTL